ncbi:type II toxin-antitoxin system VapC family toxin [uncultured Sphingomonas sp.]|uniref:type II toxin-antitoxin system VapC family toxin n=1 Tax=uncultured Sphingomonas sp. TaxID=158754 RepID=UPI0035CAFB8B
MRLILDTHALLWMLQSSQRLSPRVVGLLGDPETEILVSAVSAYEICAKYTLGKLPEAAALASDFVGELAPLDLTPLAVTLARAETAGKLPMIHRDPFDRLLIAQALVERVPLVSNEALFDGFGIERIW